MNAPQQSSRTPMIDLPMEALDYDLPDALIARRPAEPRDSARLLVVRRSTDRIEHRTVCDLPEYIGSDDLMVFNDTAVLPARLAGRRTDTGGRVEGLYLDTLAGGQWKLMLKSNGKLRVGQSIKLLDSADRSSGFVMELEARQDAEWIARIHSDDDTTAILNRVGRTPLPPYILRARSHSPGQDSIADAADRAWYQTVYADRSHSGSVAAPTAGLHFTDQLLAEFGRRGVERRHVTLHVGPGTFKPIDAPTLSGHVMHSERYMVSPEVCKSLNEATSQHRRIVAVGTTTVRTLESLPRSLSQTHTPVAGETDLLIAPGYEFQYVQAIMTNFHLPRSTLLALVGAFIGLDRLHEIYRVAIAERYRFYSYGDAMLILP